MSLLAALAPPPSDSLLAQTLLDHLDTERALDEFILERWDERDGLPHPTIFDIAQTPDGHIWLGTRRGLVRFNGVDFTSVASSETVSLSEGPVVLSLMVAGDGTLWAGLEEEGLVFVRDAEGGLLVEGAAAPLTNVRALAQAPDGTIWAGGAEGVVRGSNDQWTPVELPTAATPIVHDIAIDQGGVVWFATESDGVFSLTGDRFVRYDMSAGLPENYVRVLLAEPDGGVWAGLWSGGLAHIDGNDVEIIRVEDGLPRSNTRSLELDRAGTLWVGTRNGLARMTDRSILQLRERTGWDRRILSLFEDTEGSIWAGTYNGLSRLRQGSIRPFKLRIDGRAPFVAPVIEMLDGTVLAGGHARTGLIGLRGTEHQRLLDFAPNALSLSEDVGNPGRVMVGTEDGLFVWNSSSAEGPTLVPGTSGLRVPVVYGDPDSPGAFWIGLSGRGVRRLEEGRLSEVTNDPRLSDVTPSWMGVGADGRLWVATRERGLFCIWDNAVMHLARSDGLASNRLSSGYLDDEGVLWVGSRTRGLTVVRGRDLLTVGTAQGLPDNVIWSITGDDTGRIWMSSDRGIWSVDRANLLAAAEDHGTRVDARLFGVADGMSVTETNGRGFPAVARDQAGALWYPTQIGLVKVDPKALSTNPVAPPVHIESVVAHGDTFPAHEDLVLPHNRRDLEIHYSGLSFRQPHRINFRYRLDGYDEDWIDAGPRRVAYYTGLPPGDFKFDVMAANEDGVWNTEGTSLPLTIPHRIWETWGARGAALVFMALVLYGTARARVRSIEMRNEELTREMRERQATEERLRVSEERYRVLVETAPEAILVLDLDTWTFADANANAERMFGLSKEEILSIGIEGVAPVLQPDGRPSRAAVRVLAQAAHQGEAPYLEWWLKRSDDTVFPCELRLSKLPSTKRNLVRGSIIDITERKESERALRQAHLELEALRDRLEEENLYLREEIKLHHDFEDIVGDSPSLHRALAEVERVAPTDTTVLILGETGTGKELFATAIHELSDRSSRPLVRVNCAALPPNLIESELFGHEQGAFTGATARRKGRFELAHRGTLFLDETGELPPNLQVKLLRVLQEGEFERIGGTETIKVDVRLITATNRDLLEAVRKGSFREDLYFRINVFPINIPPLRDRKGDIVLLAKHYGMRYAATLGKSIDRISASAIRRLEEYDWPGNVRELRNVIERAVVLTDGPELRLPNWSKGSTRARVAKTLSSEDKPGPKADRAAIVASLERNQWVILRTARELGMSRPTLYRRLAELDIRRPDGTGGASRTTASG